MHLIEFGKDRKRQFPEHIGELSAVQYHYFVQLILMLHKGHVSVDEMQIMMVYEFLGLNYSGNINEDMLLGLSQLKELTEPFFEKVDGTIKPVTNCAANLVPEIRLGIRRFKGPAHALADTNVRQFVKGLTYLNSFAEEGERKYLVKLISEHYSRINPLGKARSYNEDACIQNEKYFSAAADHILYGFYFFYQSAIEFLTTQDVPLDDGRVYNFSALFSSAGEKGQSVGPQRVLFALAHNDVFGNINETGNHNIVEALVYMLDRHYENEEAKDKLKNDRTR